MLNSALLNAVIQNQYEAADALLATGVLANEVTPNDLNSALHHAILNDNKPMCELLLEFSTKINTPNKKGVTPIELAASLQKWDFVKLFTEFCTAVEDQNGFYFALCQAAKHDQLDTVTALLTAKTMPNTREVQHDQLSPLDHAIANGNNDMIQLLVKYGASVVARAPKIVSPMMQAALTGNWDGLILLANAKNKDHKEADLDEALCYAAEQNQLESVIALLKAGAEPSRHSRLTPSGRHALNFAVMNDNPEMAKVLIIHGAKLEDKNSDGLTPIELATTTGKWQLIPVMVYSQAVRNDLADLKHNVAVCAAAYQKTTNKSNNLKAKLQSSSEFHNYSLILHKTLRTFEAALRKYIDNFGLEKDTNKQLQAIIKFIIDHPDQQLKEEDKSTLQSLCNDDNQFAHLLVSLQKYIYWFYNNYSKLKKILEEMQKEISTTAWKVRVGLGTKSAKPPHIEDLTEHFASTNISRCNSNDLFRLYINVVKTLSTTEEKNRYRFNESQAFYDKYRNGLAEITFNDYKIDTQQNILEVKVNTPAKESPVIAQVGQNLATQPLKVDTKPEVAPPFTSTTARLYPTLDFATSNTTSSLYLTAISSLNPANTMSPATLQQTEKAPLVTQSFMTTTQVQTHPVADNMQIPISYVLPEVPKETLASHLPDFPPPTYNEHMQRSTQSHAGEPTYTENRPSTFSFNLFPAPSVETRLKEIQSLPTPPSDRPVVATPKSAGRQFVAAS